MKYKMLGVIVNKIINNQPSSDPYRPAVRSLKHEEIIRVRNISIVEVEVLEHLTQTA